ncbi:MAG TPA: 2,3-diaminopropionate biosynthesis protein SbnA [Thermoanaerobaculia bacterium]|nr:2,3-diaminopropionate biosynthesis protein SbnA [Thermoanaerobaculia bacterium]
MSSLPEEAGAARAAPFVERLPPPGALPRRGAAARDSVLEAIGETPLVRLRRLFPDPGPRVYAKLEALNPGGSIKDRPALAILQEALRSGAADGASVVVESSSGNMGIGLAQACRYHGLRFICVVDPKTTAQNLRLLRAYGAEIDLVAEPDPATGEFLPARLQRVAALVAQVPGAFWPNQYANRGNPRCHYRTTMHEIASELESLDYLFVGTSTCGTLLGCTEYVRDHRLPTRVVAVDAVGSLIFGDVQAKRMIPGLGAGLKPPFCEPSLVDRCVHVSDLDCVVGCRRLALREAILAGGSSGGVVAAVEKLRDEIPAGAVCAAILPDRGERYLDTIYCDDWVREHFGDVPGLAG